MTAHALHPLKDGRAPVWAFAWGEDKYGAFAAFAIGSPGRHVEQRMRWIPPGMFLMGSPPTELGRSRNESPQHEVTLTCGFWLGETPVTQALWVAVMGENPSRLGGDGPDDRERPVEWVSWDDCQLFLERVNTQIAGLAARLPTEAEWERACRAGTRGATWVGEPSGEVDAPELDAIAWYAGNSGHRSHPVGRKAPNSYGLYDMLGNVYEWCHDGAVDLDDVYPYRLNADVDPVWTGHSSLRVCRGGSWFGDARCVRAASRGALARHDRIDFLGLRLAGRHESVLR